MLCCCLPISLQCASIQAHKLGKVFFPALRADKTESSWTPSSHRHFSPGGQSPGQPWRPPKHWWYTELGVPALIYSVWVSCAHGLAVQWGRNNESWRSWWEKSYMVLENFLQNISTGTPVLPPQQAFKWWGLRAFLSYQICLPSLASSWPVRIWPSLCVCSHFFLPLAISLPWIAISGQLGSRVVS